LDSRWLVDGFERECRRECCDDGDDTTPLDVSFASF